MIDSRTDLDIIIPYLISARGIIVLFYLNNQDRSLDLADFILQEKRFNDRYVSVNNHSTHACWI